jgi:geranylgeranyl pyrophosphate synthase
MSVLKAHLAESRARVDGFLDETLPPAVEPPGPLHEAMRYAVFAGGKRLRPALAFGGALACGAAPECALPVAAAVELVHAYSLVHDDLPAMDDDAERRGRPTVHVKFGEATAILTGDALLAQAFATLAAASPPADVVERLARAAGSRELVGGQVDDLAFGIGATPTQESVRSIHARKTGALFRFATWGGGRLGRAEPEACAALDRFGLEYGLAFQLADDLSERDGEECSALRVLAPEQVRELGRGHLERGLAALEPFAAHAAALRALADYLWGQLA